MTAPNAPPPPPFSFTFSCYIIIWNYVCTNYSHHKEGFLFRPLLSNTQMQGEGEGGWEQHGERHMSPFRGGRQTADKYKQQSLAVLSSNSYTATSNSIQGRKHTVCACIFIQSPPPSQLKCILPTSSPKTCLIWKQKNAAFLHNSSSSQQPEQYFTQEGKRSCLLRQQQEREWPWEKADRTEKISEKGKIQFAAR